MSYISNTKKDLENMLKEIGMNSIEELFADIPEEIHLRGDLDIPAAMPEHELIAYFREIAAMNKAFHKLPDFIGAGSYFHYVPAVVKDILSRAEFYSAYTPYQPEVSQGTLQSIFEFQTYICQLTEMEVANASLYDGATALAEAALMAHRANNRSEILLSGAIHPEYRKVVQTYLKNMGLKITEISFAADGQLDIAELNKKISKDTCAVAVQSPNFFGVIEDWQKIFLAPDDKKIMKIAVITEPLSLALLNPPGRFGADIVIGEGQSLGLHAAFGGPTVGFMSTKMDHVRRMPGRLAGMAYDHEGNRGFVLTLSTREQHIRREKATSNICTNQALCALAVTVYLSLLGPAGLKKMAQVNLQRAHYLQEKLCTHPQCQLLFKSPFFNEFVIRVNGSIDKLSHKLYEEGIIAGLPLKKFYPQFDDCILVNVTELHNKDILDLYIEKFIKEL